MFLPVFVQNLVKMTNATCFSSFHQNLVEKAENHVFLQFFVRIVWKIEKTPGFYHVSSTIFSYIEKSPIFLCFIAQNIAQT